MQRNRLVIGLDYGTTYTGVSYCETSDSGVLEKHIEVIRDWPARHTKIGTKEKVPSEIVYGPDGTQWGSLIPPNAARHMWTKLELDRPQTGEAAKILLEQKVFANLLDKKPEDIVADYLEQVKDHLVVNLDNQYGRDLWSTLPITLVVTVPAVWSDAAKDPESEAAAIYTIKTMRGSAQDELLNVEDGFIVCDMRGGTVDLISYSVTKLQPTTVKEITVGNGDQCGGIFVDRAFLQWLERRLGTTDFIKIAGCRSEDVPRTSLSTKAARMLQDFTLEIKSGFSGHETNFLRLSSPLSASDDDARGFIDGEIKIEPHDLVTMFEFPVRRTYELLLEQLQQARKLTRITIKYVFMVGGFAESPYMYSKIKKFAEANGLKAVRPSFAWSAVCRGAAATGLEAASNPVITRKSRRHYGTSYSSAFVKGLHLEHDAFFSEFGGDKRANNQASWLVTKGQDLSAADSTHASMELCRNFYPDEDPKVIAKLLACDLEVAPSRSAHTSVYTVATLKVDLRDTPTHCRKHHISPTGRTYHSIYIFVNISMQSSLEFFVTVNNQKYGTVTVDYE